MRGRVSERGKDATRESEGEGGAVSERERQPRGNQRESALAEATR